MAEFRFNYDLPFNWVLSVDFTKHIFLSISECRATMEMKFIVVSLLVLLVLGTSYGK